MRLKHALFACLLLLIVLPGCRLGGDDGLSWDQDLVAPILTSRLDLDKVIAQSPHAVVNPDHSITIVLRDTLMELALADLLVVPDTAYQARITLDSITLATDTLVQDITMAEIAAELCAQGQSVFCNLQPGTFIPYLPPLNGLSAPDQTINASQFFQEADLIAGQMVTELENHLPVTITEAKFHLRNNGNYSDTLVKETFYNIPTGGSATATSSLAGKTVESNMAARVENFSTAEAPSGITYNPDDYLRVRLIVSGLRATRATAVFPAQRVLDDPGRIRYYFGNGVEITRLTTLSGNLRLDAISTLQDTIAFTYALPTAVRNGHSVALQGRLVPQPGGAQAHINLPLEGYHIDMTLNGDSVNLFPYHLTGDLLYSGQLNTMDVNDSIRVSYGLENIVPAYIEGYFGQSTFTYQDSVRFQLLRRVLGGSLALHRPTVKVTFANSMGMDGQVIVRSLTAVNHARGQQVALTGAAVQGPIEVRGPRLPNSGQTILTPLSLTATNSNIDQLLSILPDALHLDLAVNANHNGNPALHNNFATAASKLAAYLDVEVPLAGSADNLWLQDTVRLQLGEANLPRAVKSGQLRLVAQNGFPLEVKANVLLADGNGFVFDSLFAQPQVLAAGSVGATGEVVAPTSSVLTADWDQARLTRLRQDGRQAILRFVLSTRPSGQPLRLLSTYGIDVTLVGNFQHHVGR